MVKVKNAKSNKRLSEAQKLPKKKMNPFEIHVNRQKYEVLGRKLKHDRGLPGVARTKAIKKRKATLLQEYKIKNKSNEFVDRRIGEKNTAMTAEDRIIARFTAERVKTQSKKKSIFNLADDEVLTHKGQTLNEIEKFDDPRSDEEDEDDRGKLEAKFVGDAHFGGGFLRKKEDTESTTLNRQNLIQQLIIESKKRKAEKKRESEKTAALTDKLDADWRDLQPMVLTGKKNKNKITPEEPEPPKPKMDSYDLAVRELMFEARGKPSDRLKTEEEIALEERDRLERLEEERVQRMHGVLEGGKPGVKHRSADDLDDGFELEEPEETLSYDEKGQLVGDSTALGVQEEITESVAESDEESSEEDEEQSITEEGVKEDQAKNSQADESDDDDYLSDLKYSSGDEDNKPDMKYKEIKDLALTGVNIEASYSKSVSSNDVKADLLLRKETMEKARKELPFTFQAPETYEALQKLLEKREICQQIVILERMIKCNHPSLGAGNRERLGTLFAFLLQWLHDNAVDPGEIEFGLNPNRELVNALLPHLFDLAQLSGPGNARRCMAAVLTEKYETWQESGSDQFPGFDTLLFFQLVPYIFPASDFRHPVTSPAVVMMANMLVACKVKNLRDICQGLYICQILLQYTALSKRFLPESFRFLTGIITLAVPGRCDEKYCGDFDPPGAEGNWDILDSNSMQHSNDNNINFNEVFETTLTILLQMAVHIKNSVPSLPSLLSPALDILAGLPVLTLHRYPMSVQEKIKLLKSQLQETSKLEKLVAEKKRPKPLKMFEPAIEKIVEGKRPGRISEKKRESLKLRHKYKREMKGAVREIRRDRSFLAKLQLKEAMKSDAERKEKVKQIMGSIATQAGEINKLDRKRKK